MVSQPIQSKRLRRPAFVRACAALETALDSPLRGAVAAAAARQPTMRLAMAYLIDRMRGHAWRAAGTDVDLNAVVDDLDRATRVEGFHVLHDWNGKADQVTANTIPVDALEFASAQIGDRDADSRSLAVALDYYFLYLLALVAMRAWDAGEPGANLDRVTELLAHLQGRSAVVSGSPTTRRRSCSLPRRITSRRKPATTCC